MGVAGCTDLELGVAVCVAVRVSSRPLSRPCLVSSCLAFVWSMFVFDAPDSAPQARASSCDRVAVLRQGGPRTCALRRRAALQVSTPTVTRPRSLWRLYYQITQTAKQTANASLSGMHTTSEVISFRVPAIAAMLDLRLCTFEQDAGNKALSMIWSPQCSRSSTSLTCLSAKCSPLFTDIQTDDVPDCQ